MQASVVCAFAALTVLLPVSAKDECLFATNVDYVAYSGQPYPFHAVASIRGSGFDQSSWQLYIPTTGLYMTTLTAGHISQHHTEYGLVMPPTPVATLYRSESLGNSNDTMGLDTIRAFDKGQPIYIGSGGPALMSTSEGLHTSWGTFFLQSTQMNVQVGFGVARTSNYAAGLVPFDLVMADVGDGWTSSTNSFLAAKPGVYFFSFSTGTSAGESVNFQLRVNENALYSLRRTPGLTAATDTMARSVILNLNSGDKVDIYSEHAGLSNNMLLASFNGFQYNTERSTHMAWAVYNTDTTCDFRDPLPFANVDVNVNNVFVNNKVRCPWTGLYYVHVSAGVTSGFEVELHIRAQEQVYGALQRTGTDSYIDTISRSAIVPCAALEEIWIVQPAQRCAGSSNGRETSFAGFYLFA